MSSLQRVPGLKPDAGFSLMEVIVALALLSLITAMLAGSIKSTRSILAMIDRNTTASALLPAQSYLRAALTQTVPAPGASAPDATPSLTGEPASIRFRTLYSPKGLIEGLYDIQVRLEPSANRAQLFDLVVRQKLARQQPPAGPDETAHHLRSVLASNVRSVSFRYFGADTLSSDEADWSQTWSSAERLPRLVRVEVTFAPDEAQSWRALDFPLQLAD
jgi:general secretion pathway protein J